MLTETEKLFFFFFENSTCAEKKENTVVKSSFSEGGKKGTEPKEKQVNRGASRLWESFHHWVFCQSPTARLSFANCLGEEERPAVSRLAAASTGRFEATQNEQFCMKKQLTGSNFPA